jgi:hypothetical protein
MACYPVVVLFETTETLGGKLGHVVVCISRYSARYSFRIVHFVLVHPYH